MKYNSPSAENCSIKHKLVKWAHVPVDLHINNDATKKEMQLFFLIIIQKRMLFNF